MIKKIAKVVYNFLLGGLSFFSLLRYWLLNLKGIDLITSVCLAIIAVAGAGKVLIGWKLPIIDNFPRIKKLLMIFKTKPEKYLDLAEEEDFSAFNNLRGGKKYFMNVKSLFSFIFKFAWANKVTSTGNLIVITFYYALVEQLINKYQYWHLGKAVPSEFYYYFCGYTIATIFVLIAINIGIWDSVESYFARVGVKKAQKYVNKIINLDISLNLGFVEKCINKGLFYLNKYKDLIPKEIYLEIKKQLDYYKNELIKEKKLIELRETKRKQEDEMLLKQYLNVQPQQPKQPPRPVEQQPNKPLSREEAIKKFNEKHNK